MQNTRLEVLYYSAAYYNMVAIQLMRMHQFHAKQTHPDQSESLVTVGEPRGDSTDARQRLTAH